MLRSTLHADGGFVGSSSVWCRLKQIGSQNSARDVPPPDLSLPLGYHGVQSTYIVTCRIARLFTTI